MDFGDIVTGVEVRDDGSGRFPRTRTTTPVTGEVVALYPQMPDTAAIRLADGTETYVRVSR